MEGPWAFALFLSSNSPNPRYNIYLFIYFAWQYLFGKKITLPRKTGFFQNYHFNPPDVSNTLGVLSRDLVK